MNLWVSGVGGGRPCRNGRFMGMRIRLWGDPFHLEHIDHRKKPNEKQKKENEKSDRSNEECDIHPGRREVAPGGG